MFKKTTVELGLMTDNDMHQLVEIGITGGVSYIAQRYVKLTINI